MFRIYICILCVRYSEVFCLVTSLRYVSLYRQRNKEKESDFYLVICVLSEAEEIRVREEEEKEEEMHKRALLDDE